MVEKIDGQIKENIARLRNLEINIAFAQEQLQNLERMLMEITATRTSLNEMKKLKKDAPSIMPFGSGIYAAGSLQKQDKILADVGAGIIVEKTLDEAAKMLDEKEGTIRKNITAFQQQFGNLEREYGALSAETQGLIKK